MNAIRTRVLAGFSDPAIQGDAWERLLSAGDTNVVFLTREWQQTWWESFGRGKLLLILAERAGQAVLLAPLYCDSGMIFFVGSGGSDYLDFIGDASEPGLLEAILGTARDCTPDLLGFHFYHVPDQSRTGQRLQQAAEALGLDCVDEGSLPSACIGTERQSRNGPGRNALRA